MWLKDGTNGSQLLTPDQRIAAVGYAMMADSVPDGAITGAKIAAGAITAANIAGNSITAGQLASGAAAANLNAGRQSGVASGGLVLSATENPGLANAGYVRIGGTLTTNDLWQQHTSGSPPGGRCGHSAVWTGSDMIVWGVYNGAFVNDGERYDPAANLWKPLQTTGAPAGRTTPRVASCISTSGHEGVDRCELFVESQLMKFTEPLLIASCLSFSSLLTPGAECDAAFAAHCADRAAIERVYHSHRTGTKQTFGEAMPQALLEQVVRQDQRKESVQRKVYSVEITPAKVAAEVGRINTTTRAPEVLAEIKHALGDDAACFASAMARPIVVERELRRRFDNDEKLHAAQREEADAARASLIAKNSVANLHGITWQLAPRPADDKPAPAATPAIPTENKSSSKAYTNEATAQVAQPLTPPDKAAPGKERHYFEDVDPELQKVLGAQLQKPGDVSAVIETPGCFLVFLTKTKTAEILTVSSLTIPKRSCEEWLALH